MTRPNTQTLAHRPGIRPPADAKTTRPLSVPSDDNVSALLESTDARLSKAKIAQYDEPTLLLLTKSKRILVDIGHAKPSKPVFFKLPCHARPKLPKPTNSKGLSINPKPIAQKLAQLIAYKRLR